MAHATKSPTRCYALTALLHKDDGGYVVTVAQLPGVVSQADTQAEAVERIREAAAGAIETYIAEADDIPWRTPEEAGAVAAQADKTIALTVEIDG